MTCVAAAVCEDGHVVVMSDSAISYETGYRRLMSEGKWWNMGCLLIGESGSDFALSRIRQKTVKVKKWETLRDPYTFSELVCQVQTEVKGQEGTEPIEAELLHVAETLHVIGGDGGITGPFPYTAVGHGHMPAVPLMDALFAEKRCRRRTVKRVTEVLTEVMDRTCTYVDSVQGPLHKIVFDPSSDFIEL